MKRTDGAFESLVPFDADGGVVASKSETSIRGFLDEAGRLRMAPRGVAQVVDTALEIVRDKLVVWIGVTALLWLPVRALQSVIGPHVWFGDAAEDMFGGDSASIGGMYAGLLAGQLAYFWVHTLATAYIALGVSAYIDGRPFRPLVELGRALRAMLGLLVILVATTFATSIGMLMCFVPYVILSFKLSFWPQSYIVEREGIGRSLNRTIELTRGSFLRWVGMLVIAGAFVMPFTSLAAAADSPPVRAAVLSQLSIADRTLDAWLIPLTSLAYAVATTVMGAAVTVFYFDCRARRDGADLRRELDLMKQESLGRRDDLERAPERSALGSEFS